MRPTTGKPNIANWSDLLPGYDLPEITDRSPPSGTKATHETRGGCWRSCPRSLSALRMAHEPDWALAAGEGVSGKFILRETRSGRPRQPCRSTRLRFASAAPCVDLVAPNPSTPRLALAGPGPRQPFSDQLVAERTPASCHDPELAPVPVFITPLQR